MIALVTIIYTALVVLIYRVMKIKPTPWNIAGMVVLGVFVIGTIVIAWNGSTETARTIALGMPFIRNSERVCVLTIKGGTVPGPSGEQVADQLIRHGVR